MPACSGTCAVKRQVSQSPSKLVRVRLADLEVSSTTLRIFSDVDKTVGSTLQSPLQASSDADSSTSVHFLLDHLRLLIPRGQGMIIILV